MASALDQRRKKYSKRKKKKPPRFSEKFDNVAQNIFLQIIDFSSFLFARKPSIESCEASDEVN